MEENKQKNDMGGCVRNASSTAATECVSVTPKPIRLLCADEIGDHRHESPARGEEETSQ